MASCQMSSTADCNLYLLLDHAGIAKLRVRLENSSLSWCSLFNDTVEHGALEVTPILVLIGTEGKLSASRRFLEWTYESAGLRSSILMLLSPLGLNALCLRLTERLEVSLTGGMQAMLRFYDPRVFAALTKNLDTEQRNWFFGVANRWWYIDRLGVPIQFETGFKDDSIVRGMLVLSQLQEDALVEESETDQILNIILKNFAESFPTVSATDRNQAVIDAINLLKREKIFSIRDAACKAAEFLFEKELANVKSTRAEGSMQL